MLEGIIVWLLIINILSFSSMRSNKRYARFSRYKIDDNTLIILSVLGGSIGVIAGMNYYKYLIKKPFFKFVITLILILQIILFLILLLG